MQVALPALDAAARASVVMTVVVGLPWVPAMPTSVPPLTAAARASARRTSGRPAARAACISGWAEGMADE